MKKLLIIICLTATTSSQAGLNLLARNINFSGCTLSGPQNLTGDLTAHNAQFGLLTVNGLAILVNTVVSEQLIVAGEIDCNNCILESVIAEGPTTFHRTTIKTKLTTTGRTECKDNCTIGEIDTTGNVILDTATILGSIKTEGKLTKINNTTFVDATIKGTLKGKNLNGKNLRATGNSNLSNSTLAEAAEFAGLTKLTESIFNNLIVTGNTKTINCKASDATIIGKLDAENCEFKSLSLQTETAMLSNCSIETLYIQKEALVVTIKAPKNGAQGIIKKIIADNSKTQIIYEESALQTRDIIGTTLIRTLQKN